MFLGAVKEGSHSENKYRSKAICHHRQEFEQEFGLPVEVPHVMSKLLKCISEKQQGDDFKLLSDGVCHRLRKQKNQAEDLKYQQNGKGNLYGKEGRECRKRKGYFKIDEQWYHRTQDKKNNHQIADPARTSRTLPVVI